MMMQMAFYLAAFSAALELMLVWKLRLYPIMVRSSSALSIIMSIALSYAIGTAFGASGLIVMMAALMSTVATTIVYQNDLLPPMIIAYQKAVIVAKALLKILMVIFKAVTKIVNLIVAASESFNEAQAQTNTKAAKAAA